VARAKGRSLPQFALSVGLAAFAATPVALGQSDGRNARRNGSEKEASEALRAAAVVAGAQAQAESTDLPPGLRGRPIVRMVRIETPPEIDGALDEPVWEQAPVIADFTQIDPDEGAEPTERTECRLLYDRDHLYVGVRCFDSEPGEIRVRELQRDAQLSGSDRVSFVIDTFNDRRNGFFFETNPGAARRDGLVEDQDRIRIEWDGIWNVKTSVDEQGWAAEFIIPFKTVSFDPNESVWGFNVARFIRRKTETIRWAAATRDLDLITLSEAGALVGLEEMRQGLGLDIEPSASVTTSGEGSGAVDSTVFEPALDIFYKPSPFLTAALTLNTDFAETEVDERRVNLTRFPLFFPEQRAFFLQDAGIFEFGGLSRSPLPFFSRRIGIGPDGREREILAGVKATGRYEALNFGFLNVLMKDDELLGQKNFTVGRVALNVGEESTLGSIFTVGDPNTTGDNALVGADFNYRNSRDFDGGILSGNAWFEHSFSSGASVINDGSDEIAFGLSLDYDSDVWAFGANAEQIGEDLNPALGFVRRRGVRQYFLRARRRWRPEAPLNRFDLDASLNATTDLGNTLESAEITPLGFTLANVPGDRISGEVNLERERLFEPFEIMDGVVLPVDTYDWVTAEAEVATSDARPLAASALVRYGGFFNGTRLDTEFELTWRPSRFFFASAELIINDVDLDQGDFVTRIGRARINVSFSPDLTWSNFIQYDNVSETVGLNSRVKWIIKPGNEVFFVVNQAVDVDDGAFDGIGTEITFKTGVTLRF